MTAHLHRFWIGEVQPLHAWTGRVLAEVHGQQVTDWTPETLPEQLLALVAGRDRRHIANRVRYALLYEYGGLWVDHDVLALAPLTGAAEPWTASLGGRREGSVMWFPEPGHPMLAALLEASDTQTGNSVEASGARLLDRIGADFDDVGHEPRVLPLDRNGGPTTESDAEPLAVHLWQTSALLPASAQAASGSYPGSGSVPVVTVNPPRRMFPRDDPLGVASTRTWPPAKSTQASIRRGPGSYL